MPFNIYKIWVFIKYLKTIFYVSKLYNLIKVIATCLTCFQLKYVRVYVTFREETNFRTHDTRGKALQLCPSICNFEIINKFPDP